MTDINEIQTPISATLNPDAPKRRGRPPGNRQSVREPVRQANVESPRGATEYTEDGKIIVYSSSGERLTRKRAINSDQFYIPPNQIPENTAYQWNTVEVYGRPEIQAQIAMRENGWRPVPASRHPEMFMPGGQSGNEIIRDGLRLEERPLELTEEAQQEEREKASRLMRDQQEQLGLTQKMPDGFSRDNPNLRRMERSGTSRTYAPAPDAPRPRLPIEG